MKTILTALLMTLAIAPAFAEGENEALDDAVYECVAGENHDGDKISAEESKSACLLAIKLLKEAADAK